MTKLCLCCNEDSSTYHIYECKTIINDCNFTDNKYAKCNHIERLKPDCLLTCEDEDDMRIKIAELVNDGEQICGVCVATLYKND